MVQHQTSATDCVFLVDGMGGGPGNTNLIEYVEILQQGNSN